MWRRLLGGAVGLLNRVPGMAGVLSRRAINSIVGSTRARPYPFSLWSPEKLDETDEQAGYRVDSARYTSWPGLVDRSFSGRHLPPAPEEYTRELPPVESVLPLFARDAFVPCPRSSVLFAFFAQWFTDSFLRTHPVDRRKNTSNHEIDLCQIYGLAETTTDLLRSEDGLLRSETLPAGEFPEKLFAEDGSVRGSFGELPYTQKVDAILQRLAPFALAPERRNAFYATGLDRGNSTILYTAVSTIFLREHNRLCRAMKERYGWNDDRLFQTARNVNITLLLKIIVEDYINHLASAPVRFQVDVGFAEKQHWYRSNRMAIEFDLLYRWHGLVPDVVRVGETELAHEGFRFNNRVLEQHGAEALIREASQQRAGRMALGNSPAFLLAAERSAIEFGRQFHLRSYNRYRECFGKPRASSFRELTGESEVSSRLEALYPHGVDQLELVVGLLAEDQDRDVPLGDLMTTMVGVDAFSQALTNPLLSQNVFGEDTFSEIGLRAIEETQTFEQMVRRNSAADASEVYASFTWDPGS